MSKEDFMFFVWLLLMAADAVIVVIVIWQTFGG